MIDFKLNPSKTEFLIDHEQQHKKYPSLFPLPLAGDNFQPSKSVKRFSVIFNQIFTFRPRVS